jgi:hypothetical protein
MGKTTNDNSGSVLENVSKATKGVVSDKEGIFTSALLKPMYLTAIYLFVLKLMAEALNKQAEELPYLDPFKKV